MYFRALARPFSHLLLPLSHSHLRAGAVVPRVPSPGVQEPHVDLHVEEDEGQEGDDA